MIKSLRGYAVVTLFACQNANTMRPFPLLDRLALLPNCPSSVPDQGKPKPYLGQRTCFPSTLSNVARPQRSVRGRRCLTALRV